MSNLLATVGSVAVIATGGPPGARSRETAPAPGSSTATVPETRAVARQAAEAQGRYQIRIHTDTLRIITEIVDTNTGDVLMYLPPGYRPNAEPLRSSGDDGSTP